MFEKEIKEYESLLELYCQKVTDRMATRFQTAIRRMQQEINEKKKQSIAFPFLF